MNHFYVLRANREAGPFTRAELKAYGLLATDLLWVDGESQEWKHPAEIDGLEITPSNDVKKESAVPTNTPSVPVVSAVSSAVLQPAVTAALPPEDFPSSFVHQNETIFRRHKNYNAVPYAIGARLFGVAVLLIGLFFCGFVVVNMVKQLSAKPAAVSEAVEIHTETLPASNAAHTAEALPEKPLSSPLAIQKPDTVLQEVSLEKKQAVTTIATKASKTQKDNRQVLTAPPVTAVEEKETPPPQAVEEKPEPPKPVTAASLQLSANDYKVGLFGGISELEITVANPSGQSVAKAIVEVEFLKPNGNVVRTQTVTAENLAAGSSKTLAVPSSGRGVKVRYHVVSVE